KVIRVFDYDDGLLNSSIISLKVDHVGTVWIGTFGGLYYFKEENGNIIRVQGTNYTPVTSILEDEQHSLWIGTMADGLKRFYKTKIDNYNSESGFPDDFIHNMINDLNGNIWIGTDTRGLIQLKETKIKNITKSSGLPENVISTVLTDHSGSLWAGTRNKGLCKIVGNKVVKIFNKKSGLSGNRIRSLYEDPAGSLWIGTEGGNLNKLDNGVITNFTSQLDLQSNRITDILADNSGNLWIGTDNGLYNFIDKKTTYFNVENGFSNAHIRKLMISRKNILHVGTKDGIYQKSGSTFKKLAISGEPDIDITAIYEDNHGILWIGTNGKGLYKWPASNKKSCTIKNGLPDNYIFSITEDNFGNLWMSSYKGVFKVDRKSLTNYFDSKISHLKPLHIYQANGMADSHCSNEGQPSFCKSVSGKLYYPTNMGISVINPDDFIKLNPPPPVMIEDILDNNISSINNDKITIPHQNDLIDIRFTAFDYMDPGKIKFRYKLEGYNSDWKYLLPTNERAAFYQNPGPGKYRFLVQASGNNSEWNNESAVVEFEVLSPVYSKTYFYLVLIIVILSISGILIFFKHKKKIKK
ncbi:MAG: hypothetical protein KAR38_06160, partial [Calditrichia bacterium]|nr:hypothetical protein [Calditrichia bacterium]